MSEHKIIKKAGLLIGFGMGGFVDGILFHQILQLHNMLSNRIFPNTIVKIEINMFWDGIFHAFTWLTTFIGILLLWRIVGIQIIPKSNYLFAGSLFSGWGLFNLIEGIVDHHILKLHHVVQRVAPPLQLYADVAFLISGFIFLLIGILLINASKNASRV